MQISEDEEEKKAKRTFGQLEGKYSVSEDFDKEDEEINSMFYGEDKKINML